MNALLVALLIAQTHDPVAWLVVPKVSATQTKVQSSAWKSGALAPETVAKAAGDSLVVTYYSRGKQETLTTANDQSQYTTNPDTARAATLAPNADMRFVADGQRMLQNVGLDSGRVSWQRAMQKLGLDRLKLVIGDATLVGKDGMHVDALASYPPPRSGFVEALGPPVSGEIPAWVPKGTDDVACISMRPSAVFSQVNMAFAAADPMDQALFYTHLKGLEAQLGKHFSDDALGTSPRLWTVYRKGDDTFAVLEVADAALLEKFLNSYADAIGALLPGTQVERSQVSGHNAVSVTLPSKATFAFAFDKTSIVLTERVKSLPAHFASKGRGKGTSVVASAIAYGTSENVVAKAAAAADAKAVRKDSATWNMVMTDDGLRFAGDVKAR